MSLWVVINPVFSYKQAVKWNPLSLTSSNLTALCLPSWAASLFGAKRALSPRLAHPLLTARLHHRISAVCPTAKCEKNRSGVNERWMWWCALAGLLSQSARRVCVLSLGKQLCEARDFCCWPAFTDLTWHLIMIIYFSSVSSRSLVVLPWPQWIHVIINWLIKGENVI